MDEESYMSHDNDDSSSVVDETLTTTYANPTVRNENVGVDGIDGDEGDERGDLELSAIEGAVLGEYTRLSTNLKTVSRHLLFRLFFSARCCFLVGCSVMV